MHRLAVPALLAAAVAILLSGCSEESNFIGSVDPGPPQVAEDIAGHLEGAYHAMDLQWFGSLLADDPDLPAYRFTLGESGCPYEFWGRDEELAIHAALFGGAAVSPPGSATGDLVITDISITLTQQTEFTERHDLYASTQNPQGIDASHFQVVDAIYDANLFLETDAEDDYIVRGELELVVAVDLQKEVGDAGKVVILEWHDLGSVRAAAPSAVVELTWAMIKSLYRTQPQAAHCPATSAEELIQDLASAYRERDWQWLMSLFVHDTPDSLDYVFVTAPSSGLPDESWGYVVEERIHRRMLQPADTPMGETPVPAELWLTSVIITMTQETAFTEREDLYSPQNPDGLSPERWKATDAIYGTDVLFDLQGPIDYQVTGQALFVVIEDLQKPLGVDGKFLVLQWNDLAPSVAITSVQQKTWSEIKNLYNTW
jgi:hypothetical protein